MKRLLVLSLLLLVSSCAHRVALSPTINPNAFAAQKMPRSVGVVFSDELKTYIQHVRPSSYSGSAHSYDFEVGNSLCTALIRSVEVAYSDVIEAKVNPSAAEYDRIIKFSLQNSNMDVYFQDGFFTSTGRANYSLSVAMEAYDGKDLKLLQRTVVNGSGFSSRQTGAFSADKHFAKAVEDGIQQVCDNVANLLISGFAEPRREE